jgi:hypothetical protein
VRVDSKSKKILAILVVCLLIALSYFAGYSIGSSNGNGAFTISGGIYPSGVSYTIYKEGSTYYAKNAYGAIDYSGASASTVIQNCINALTNGGLIFITKGQYLISSQISVSRSNVFLCGESKNSTILQSSGLGNNDMIKVQNANNFAISHMGLIGDNTAVGAAVLSIQNVNNFLVEDIEVQKAPDCGIWIMGSKNGIIRGVISHHNGNPTQTSGYDNAGLEIDAWASGTVRNENIVIQNCIFYENYGPGIAIVNRNANNQANKGILIENVVSYNNKNYGSVTDNGVGLSVYHAEDLFVNNYYTYGNQYAGFYINGRIDGTLKIFGAALESGSPPYPFKYGGAYSMTNYKKLFLHIDGYNPVGFIGVSMPSSGVSVTNIYGVYARVFIYGGTVTDIYINDEPTGLTSGSFLLAPGDTIKIVYSVAPSWKWFLM